MQIKYNVTGDRRKALVAVVRDTLQDTMRYLGAPSFAFQVGAYTVDKNGTVTCPEGTDESQIEMLFRELAHDGFIGERIGEAAKLADNSTMKPESRQEGTSRSAEPDRLAIELPKEGMTPTAMENLRRLAASKAMLLKKALDTNDLPITEHPDRIEFGWFRPTDDQAEIAAYYQLVQGLCELARAQKRVSATEQEVENEKYAFRCFLLRLGFIGAEYKEARKILLKNLTGNAAFRTAREAGDEE
ncbi:MAG: virulence protein [Eubacteriales bacterium]|nr:virulence protein [Eubacteriales bacterium]